MPRPRKCRKVCCMPKTTEFSPTACHDDHRVVFMTVDEYETLRLMDHEGLTQEACAEQMGVSRTSVQAIYASARKKVALCLVEGRMLQIRGGDVRVCEEAACGGGRGRGCGKACRHRHCKE